ncbi:SufS family cysteine desulfurase [Enhydrobacter sp.]|jgi:cysteine desulfurase/selenocysteine lyase|uniref:aminotransferase class V-fold PLP-dependent enzyme n=1 Tax=Enhydrobacter sp. TaxID=1894999 RepID=UPI0026105BDE|nr:SufS family cysteine desulfurase [Enhydrobacter sp.]WIM13865.1 MAG: cysteine desulfurase [Enhydrobacter sp.]
MSFDVAFVRRQFPILSEIIDGRPIHYLDNGASAQSPLAVLDAVRAYETTGRANVLRGVHRLAERATEAYENARAEVAKFLGVQPLEIVFTGGCTAAINLVAYSYGQLLKPGDRILLSELEHHSNIVPWQLLRQRSGVELDMVPVTADGRIDLAALPGLLTDKTKLVSLAHVSNVTGALLDVRAVVEAAKAVGAKVMLDGAQRAPHGPLDLAGLGIDFYAFAGHKAYGPNGIGVLWARPELLEAMPPFHGGGSMIGRVTLAETTWAPPPRRFEAGTPPIGPAIGLGAACKWMAALDWSAAHDHEMALVQRLMDGLQEIDGTRLLGPASLQNRYPVVSFMLDGVHPHDVAQTLDAFGVAVRAGHHCAQPLMDRFDLDGTTRASMAPYNDNDDIDALLAGVRHAAKTLR